jgi:DNA (cytosine-5)-methyltransferase 1
MLVLSLFPGIGLLDRAFELEGFCVVRGPDLLWGGDVRNFRPPVEPFDGVIGGPPCKRYSQASGGTSHADDLIPEFERVVCEACPRWFVMENVVEAPIPAARDFVAQAVIVENRDCGGVQKRVRRFTFGWSGAMPPPSFATEWWAEPASSEYAPTVTGNATIYAGAKPWNPRASRSSRSRSYLARAIELQGLPKSYELPGFTVAGAIEAVANGVPLPMGRAVARAVKRALEKAGAAA